MRDWIFLFVALLFNVFANILMKAGAIHEKHTAIGAPLHTRIHHFMNTETILSILLFAANVVLYRKALSGLPISIAYPVMVSLGLVLVIILAHYIPAFKERITVMQIVGMVMIVAGVWLVSRSMSN